MRHCEFNLLRCLKLSWSCSGRINASRAKLLFFYNVPMLISSRLSGDGPGRAQDKQRGPMTRQRLLRQLSRQSIPGSDRAGIKILFLYQRFTAHMRGGGKLVVGNRTLRGSLKITPWLGPSCHDLTGGSTGWVKLVSHTSVW